MGSIMQNSLSRDDLEYMHRAIIVGLQVNGLFHLSTSVQYYSVCTLDIWPGNLQQEKGIKTDRLLRKAVCKYPLIADKHTETLGCIQG